MGQTQFHVKSLGRACLAFRPNGVAVPTITISINSISRLGVSGVEDEIPAAAAAFASRSNARRFMLTMLKNFSEPTRLQMVV